MKLLKVEGPNPKSILSCILTILIKKSTQQKVIKESIKNISETGIIFFPHINTPAAIDWSRIFVAGGNTSTSSNIPDIKATNKDKYKDMYRF